MTVDTAIIPVAGLGTRVFPVTTVIEKCLLPIYTGSSSRPIIDYMVDDCQKAGIKRILFITSIRGKEQLQNYFGSLQQNIVDQLLALGKADLLQAEKMRRLDTKIEFEYIIQPPGKYGTSIPLALAEEKLRGEDKFIMMGGDDIVYHADGQSELKLALVKWEQYQTDHVILGSPISRTEAVKYGVLQSDQTGKLTSIVEKPQLDQVPEDPTVNITRYLFSHKIWEPLHEELNMSRGSSEYYITTVISYALRRGQSFHLHRIAGKYLDGGSNSGLFSTSAYIQSHPQKLDT